MPIRTGGIFSTLPPARRRGGAALTAWPFINQMNPDASVLALATVEVDLAPIAEGQSITLKWRGNPVFIRHRTAKEIEEAKAVPIDD